jgi:bile acid-coenzyme A ligase
MNNVVPFEAREMSLGMALSWQAAQNPDAPALTMGDLTYSRAELDRAANRLARAIAALGVANDDRVAVLLPTGPDHQITCFALWKLGATTIPLPPKLVDRELLGLVEQARPKLVIGVDPKRLPDQTVLPAGFVPDAGLSDAPLPEAIASIWKASSSGGSTGVPKLIWENRASTIDPVRPMSLLRIDPGDVILHPAAAYHNATFTQTNWGLCWGCHVVLMQKFDPLEWLRTVERHRVNWAYLVPTMMSRILALPEELRRHADVSSLKMVMHMAAPCPTWVKEAWIEWVGADTVWEIYGGTEGYGATMIGGVEWLAHKGSVGKAPPGTTVRDDEGMLLGPGEIGTIYFIPPANNPLGHPQEPRTFGDVGYVDEDGYLFLADRRTDMILSGGVNLYPAEIEGAVEQFPGVVVCAVIGLPDPDLGATAHAIIELASGQTAPSAAELAAFLAERLSANKIPQTCEFTAESLRDEAGKLRRSRLRDKRLVQGTPKPFIPLRSALAVQT